MRNLLFFLLILVGVYYLRRLFAGKARGDASHPDAAGQGAEAPREIEQVLPCAQCGLLVPASEGVEAGGQFFCSREHQKLGPGTS